MRHRAVDNLELPDVVVHAPPGFDPSSPIHLVMYFHGAYSHAAWPVVSGPLAPVTGEGGSGWGLSGRHDRAGVNALLVAPQLAARGMAHFPGRFSHPGFLRDFVEELLGDTLASRLGGARSLDDIASITLIGSSAGGPLIVGLIGRTGLDERVRNVVVMDGLYGGESTLATWLRGGQERRLVCLHAGSRYTQAHTLALATALRGARADMVVDPDGSIGEAMRNHRAVIARVACEHVGMTEAYYDKVMSGLGLPPRAIGPGELSHVAARPGVPVGMLNLGVTAHGMLSEGDACLRDSSWFDDWTLDVTEACRVRVDVHSGSPASRQCARYDVEAEVLEGEHSLAHDDDGAGGMSARIDVVLPHAGRYTVRVMEHESWATEGAYTVRVERR